MGNKKFRWSKVYESPEEELIEFLRSRNLAARRIAVHEASTTDRQTRERECTIWCAEGSLAVKHESATTSLQPGDALRVSAKIPFDLLGGITGYVCYITD